MLQQVVSQAGPGAAPVVTVRALIRSLILMPLQVILEAFLGITGVAAQRAYELIFLSMHLHVTVKFTG